MEIPNRIFNCLRCHTQVVICRYCDRGNIYCSKLCSLLSRQASIRAAVQRYQQTRQGRLNNALRQRRFRARRREKVTHQGSQQETVHTHLPTTKQFNKSEPAKAAFLSVGNSCCFCKNNATRLLRHVFLSHFTFLKRANSKTLAQGP